MQWTDTFSALAAQKTDSLTDKQIRTRWQWVESTAAFAENFLTPEKLRALPPEQIYAHLRQINFNGTPIRLTNLGRVNDAERIAEALIKLLAAPGNFDEKYRAAKFPQAGIVTITEILCAARPARFMCKSTELLRALAKVAPLYGLAALREMNYEEFLDLCRVLSEVLQQSRSPLIREWTQKYRYLWLYALLVD